MQSRMNCDNTRQISSFLGISALTHNAGLHTHYISIRRQLQSIRSNQQTRKASVTINQYSDVYKLRYQKSAYSKSVRVIFYVLLVLILSRITSCSTKNLQIQKTLTYSNLQYQIWRLAGTLPKKRVLDFPGFPLNLPSVVQLSISIVPLIFIKTSTFLLSSVPL